MIQWLIDGAAIMNQKTLADGAFGPYVRTMRRINMEEAFHFKSGEDMVLTLMSGTPKRRRQMCQDAFDRWWGPSLMFFGPHGQAGRREPAADALAHEDRQERMTRCRQRFVDRFTPAALDLGLQDSRGRKGRAAGNVIAKQPDENLAVYLEDDRVAGSYTEPDWEEFYRVIRGKGPCNGQRLALRRMSYEQGRWGPQRDPRRLDGGAAGGVNETRVGPQDNV